MQVSIGSEAYLLVVCLAVHTLLTTLPIEDKNEKRTDSRTDRQTDRDREIRQNR